tara:strand:+ start:249 stop:416 length:168 start_codon:yes stop_codon:yes gene_type:complete
LSQDYGRNRNRRFLSSATNNGAESGTVSWTPTATGTFYCQCSHQDGRVGTIGVQL